MQGVGLAQCASACLAALIVACTWRTPASTAANAFVLAKQFDLQVEQNSASVLLSTALSVVTLSGLLVYLRVS